MNILVIGADNQLGSSYAHILQQDSRDFVALDSDDPLVSEASSLKKLIADNQVTQLVNLSLNPGLFQSEQSIEKERKQHLTQVCSNLFAAAKTQKIPLIHHSSAAVFDGSNPKPYLETDLCKPNNPLGKLAQSLEKKVSKYERHIVLRTEGMFGLGNPQFFSSCISQCKQHAGKLVLLDQRCSPTPVNDVARVLLAINKQVDCDSQTWGTFHYCALQATHRHTFIEKVLHEAADIDKELSQCMDKLEISTQESSKTQLENSVLDCHKIMSAFGIKQRSRESALKELVASIYNN